MVDVTIRGAGIFGLSIAWACTLRGAKVQVIDPNGPGAGSSGGLVGALAPHVPENWNAKKAFQLESLLMAERFWSDVKDASNMETGYVRSGRIQPITDARALSLARRRGDSAKVLWQDRAIWAVVPTSDARWTVPSPSDWIIRDSLSALLHPRKSVQALARALKNVECEVKTDGVDRGPVVWATGLHGLEILNAGHHRQVGNGIKGQAALLKYDAAERPQLFVDGLHIIPHLDGTVAIGSTSEREYSSATGTDGQLDALIAEARALLPALQDAEVIEKWAGIRPRARSRAPMLGPWPGRPGHFVANGGFKIGFGMAPKVAEVMAELVLEGRNVIPEGFDVKASY
ncbi:MAG: FAD-dependent oxidoreductase [Pseudomonadota bacterium]